MESLAKNLLLFCEVFDTSMGFYLFSSLILHCLQDSCQTAGNCLAGLLVSSSRPACSA